MSPSEAKRVASKMASPRFGLLMESGNGVWIYECKSEQEFGRLVHKRRYLGCHWRGEKHKSLAIRLKPYEGFNLEQQLYRTDWTVTVVSSQVLDAILAGDET